MVGRGYRPLDGAHPGRQWPGALGKIDGLEDGGLLGTSSMCGTLHWQLQRQHIPSPDWPRYLSMNKIHLFSIHEQGVPK